METSISLPMETYAPLRKRLKDELKIAMQEMYLNEKLGPNTDFALESSTVWRNTQDYFEKKGRKLIKMSFFESIGKGHSKHIELSLVNLNNAALILGHKNIFDYFEKVHVEDGLVIPDLSDFDLYRTIQDRVANKAIDLNEYFPLDNRTYKSFRGDYLIFGLEEEYSTKYYQQQTQDADNVSHHFYCSVLKMRTEYTSELEYGLLDPENPNRQFDPENKEFFEYPIKKRSSNVKFWVTPKYHHLVFAINLHVDGEIPFFLFGFFPDKLNIDKVRYVPFVSVSEIQSDWHHLHPPYSGMAIALKKGKYFPDLVLEPGRGLSEKLLNKRNKIPLRLIKKIIDKGQPLIDLIDTNKE